MTDTPTTAAPIAQLAFGDLAHELASTRRLLERVPDGRNDWAPHAKSMTLGRLAAHVADMPHFALAIVERDELDLLAGDHRSPAAATTTERLAHFDAGVAALTTAVAALDADALARVWTLRRGAHVVLAQPRGALVRVMGINHLVHHRGQLQVYLRLLDVPVPGLYGPSADER
jgi:uncharacterized damage-inducible protein DinB